MFKMTTKQRIFFLLLTGGLILLLNQKISLLPSTKVPVSTEVKEDSASSAPLPIVHATPPNCVDEKKISEIVGRTYTHVYGQVTDMIDNGGNFFSLECFYRSAELVREVSPSTKYYLKAISDKTLWQQQLELDREKIGFREIEGKPNMYAIVSPVKEVKQVSIFAWQEPFAVEVSYAPVQENDTDLLNKGIRLTEEAFNTLTSGQN